MKKATCLNCQCFYAPATAEWPCCLSPKRNPPRIKRETPEETAKYARWEAMLQKIVDAEA